MSPEFLDTNTKASTADLLQNPQKATPLLSPSKTFTLLKNKMFQSNNEYTKLRWMLTMLGLILYLVDICTDIALALHYFQEEYFVWSGLTVLFVLVGLFVTQLFSYAWYIDDMNNDALNPEGRTTIFGMSKGGLIALHLCGMGIFTRICQLLKKGFRLVWTKTHFNTVEERRKVNHSLFCLATDLSMLKLFEAFLESAPQLLLQLHIVLSTGECSVMQYLTMAFSFFNIAWSLVDYRRCLRRSLPQISEMPSGVPTLIYLLYKLSTITSHILSFALLLTLSAYSTVALTTLWLFWTIWTNFLQTEFCNSRGLELVYRAVVGAILTFTFFNVKGQDTKVEMTLYYLFYSLVSISAPLLMGFFSPEFQTVTFLLTVSGIILGGLVMGLVCLVLYYLCLHPREKWREADEVDGMKGETETMRRMRNIIQP